jgi:hypothetical protein
VDAGADLLGAQGASHSVTLIGLNDRKMMTADRMRVDRLQFHW